jgi:hypothetical protein
MKFQTILKRGELREIWDNGLTVEEAREACHDWNIQRTDEERDTGDNRMIFEPETA